MILQLILAMSATASFAVIFCAPKNQFVFCAITGGLSFISYLSLISLGLGPATASLFAAFFLTILSRTFASLLKSPATLYLVTGIFTLAPGAGIYYTSYYLIMNKMGLFAAKGIETFKIAGAISIGILFGFYLPQRIFQFKK